MKKIFFVLLLVLQIMALYATDSDEDTPPKILVVIGPRVGAAYSFMSAEQFSADINELLGTQASPTVYLPYYSIFALNMEYRILLGDSKDHFAFQGMLSGYGIEQSIFLPSLGVLLGYRHHSGFEIGFGPIATLSGFGVIGAMGYTISFNGVYVPIDISFQLPNSKMAGAIALTTGFNFIIE